MQGQYAAMDPQQFHALADRVRKASFANNKLSEVELALRGGAVFSSPQATTLVTEIRGDKEQIEACVQLWPRVLDSWNFGEVLTGLTFVSSKDAILKRIWDVAPLPSHQQAAGGPMDPVSFSSLAVRLSKKCSFANQKFDEVKLAIHGGAFFSSVQAKALVAEIRNDNEQVAACKLLYPRIVDPSQFGDVLSALSFASSKDKVLKSIQAIPVPSAPPSTTVTVSVAGAAPPSTTTHHHHFHHHHSGAPAGMQGGYPVGYPAGGNPASPAPPGTFVAPPGTYGASPGGAGFAVAPPGSYNTAPPPAQPYYGGNPASPAPPGTFVAPPGTFGASPGGAGFAVAPPGSFNAGPPPGYPGYPGHSGNPASPAPPGTFVAPPGTYGVSQGGAGFAVPPPGSLNPGAPPSYTAAPQQVVFGINPGAASGFAVAPPGSYVPPGFAPAGPTALPHETFAGLLQRVQKASFSENKLGEIRLSVQGGAYFSSEQVRQLLQQVSFDKEQQEAAVMLYPRVVDPVNFGQALTAVKFTSTKDEIMRRVMH